MISKSAGDQRLCGNQFQLLCIINIESASETIVLCDIKKKLQSFGSISSFISIPGIAV